MCAVSGRERDGEADDVGTLYVVATPIGNREDITLRALRVLREVAIIAAEDTRHTGGLLVPHGIHARYLSLHQHNERDRAERILAHLAAGDDVALVSDAGTPAVADPGAATVAAVAAAGYPVVPVPGPSALAAAVSASGLVSGPFTFMGFAPPRQAVRRSAMAAVASLPHPLVWYEAPHRVGAWLADAFAVWGDRDLAVCRELTKLHEEITHTSVGEALRRVETTLPRGEYVLVVAGANNDAPAPADDAALDATLRELFAVGMSAAAAAKEAARRTGRGRDECYARAVELRAEARKEMRTTE